MVTGTYQHQEEYHAPLTSIVPQDRKSWQRWFSIPDAVNSVDDHIAKLKSSKTPEQHTRRVYKAGLTHFLDWLNERQPTLAIMDSYVAHLSNTGRSGATIAAKYLAPTRLFLTKLYGQDADIQRMTGGDYMYYGHIKQQISKALEIESPPKDETSNMSHLYRYGRRLKQDEVEIVLNSFDLTNRSQLRNFTIMMLGFKSALRIAELQRLTLANMRQGDDCWLLHVRGKGSKIDPVPIAHSTVKLIKFYVDSFNSDLTLDDPRYIQDTDPVFQPLTAKGNHYKYGARQGAGRYQRHDDPADKRFGQLKGLSIPSIATMIGRVSNQTLNYKIAPHDMRRTAAYLLHVSGASYDQIRVLLRHASVAQTEKYVGQRQNMAASVIDNHLTFDVQSAF